MLDSRKCFTDALLECAREDKDIMAVTTDARGSVTLSAFADELPAQFVECGIAEQNAVGISAGLAHSGKKVFCCGPACFYVARALEQVKVDVAYSRLPVKIFGVSGGVAYGALGATHHSLHDIAVLSTFPGMNIVLPSDGHMAKKVARVLADDDRPWYIRVGRGETGEVYDSEPKWVPGKAIMVQDGNDITLVGAGETVFHAMGAARILAEEGISARVLDCSSIKPFDTEAIRVAARDTGLILSVEEHSVHGGLGSLVLDSISESPVPVRILGIPDEDAVHGKSPEIFAHYCLDAAGIARNAKSFLKANGR